MKNILSILRKYDNRINLRDRFDYNFDISNEIFDQNEIDSLKAIKNQYKRNVKLKWILKEKYQGDTDTIKLDFWIINDWGGIKSFKKNERNINRIKRFKNQIKEGELTADSFAVISSLSKIASFMHPEDFVIYDSRVTYTLNWLLLLYENCDNFTTGYFPMPRGRNRTIYSLDMLTIINLFHREPKLKNKQLFLPQKDAYFQYCTAVKEISQKLFGENAAPYQLEMLLFTISTEEIPQEMREKIKITFAE